MTKQALLLPLLLVACLGDGSPGEVRSAGVGVEDIARDIAPMCAADGGAVCCDANACNCYGRAQRCFEDGEDNRIWQNGQWVDQNGNASQAPDAAPAGAGDSGDSGNDPSVDCSDYDWSYRCVDGDNWCDEGDDCCDYDPDNHDDGPCDGSDGSGVSGPDSCADYDWTLFCVDGDNWCDEGAGCCDNDADNHDGGPCDGSAGSGDEGGYEEPVDCSNYDWSTHCLEADGYCDEGDGCCPMDGDC